MTARSGYRFVPIDDTIVPPPVSFEALHRGQPHEEGSISGTLEVEWEAETPVCIGVDCGGGIVRPFEIDGRGVLPGASLRGMLRAVMEIATFSHLGRINDHRHFGFRNFADRNYTDRVTANNIKAGWLNYCAKSGKWTLTVAGLHGHIFPIEFQDVLEHINSDVCPDAWRAMSIHDKRMHLKDQANAHNPNLLRKVKFKEGPDYHSFRGTTAKRGEFEDSGGAGFVVVGGAADATANRMNEVFVSTPSSQNSHVLHEDFVKLFNRINSNPGRERPEPTGAWRYWILQKVGSDAAAKADLLNPDPHDPAQIEGCQLPGIPVFFHGDPQQASTNFKPKTCDFVMGLSRLIKIPYREGVGNVAGRLYAEGGPYKVPKLSESFDFARAIFGWTDLEEDAAGRPVHRGRARADVDALAGRVAFSPAFSDPNPTTTCDRTLVFGAPRESFYPYYLVGNYHGTSEDSRPVGRKRYPVRPPTSSDEGGTEKTQTTLRFHKTGTVYRGSIRVHNLHPVELGALIWCLGFGEIKGRWRHSIGRGKGYGYGCLKLNRVSWRQPPVYVPGNETVCTDDFDGLSRRFEEYMDKNLPDDLEFANHDAIKKLRGYANPKNGKSHGERLGYPPVEDFKNIQGPLGQGECWDP